MATPRALPAALMERLVQALAPTYVIERELGGGGMSRVFVAVERALSRRVVIKLLLGHDGQEVSGDRFAREIRLAASLQQANIVPVISAGTVLDIPYYTMPFVEGLSLRERMAAGAMPLGEIVSVLRDVARALAFAHRSGVMHRDIKPENVLLSSGTAVVTDFGIAKAIVDAIDEFANTAEMRSAETQTAALTREGTMIGTPAYMSPEQCAGDPTLDRRVDVYAWGIVALELLSGRHPFDHCHTVRAFITAHLLEKPPLDTLRADTPATLALLIERCLEKEPDDRPSNTEELLDVLDGVMNGGTTETWGDMMPADHDPPSVAVLPFANTSGHPEDEFFADGISEEIMSALAHVRGLRVAARTSCFAFKGVSVNLRDMADKLGVRTVLEGSVRRAGSRVRVSTNLVSAEQGTSLWRDRYDREIADIFEVQDEIAQSIATALSNTLRATTRRSASVSGSLGAVRKSAPSTPANDAVTVRAPFVARSHLRGPQSVEAYEEYLRGRLHLDQRSTDLASAITCFERAAALDPTLSVAHSGLAHVYTWLGLWYLAPASYAFDKVESSANRALTLDPHDAVALAARAIRTLWFEWNPTAALALAQQAIDSAPGLPLGYSVMTYVRIARSESDEAIAAAERAVAIDPLSSAARTDLGDALRFAGRHVEALQVLEPVVQREPGHLLGNLWMAYQMDALGDSNGALPHVERAVIASGRSPALVATLARILARAGRTAEATVARQELVSRGATEFIAPYLLAVASVALDPADVTLDLLDQSLAAHDCHLAYLHRDYLWDGLRDSPRFRQLVRTVGIHSAA